MNTCVGACYVHGLDTTIKASHTIHDTSMPTNSIRHDVQLTTRDTTQRSSTTNANHI